MTAHDESLPARPRGARRAWRGLVGALTFLTIIPMPQAGAREADFDLGSTLVWFPLVGGAIGAFAGGLRVACQPLFGPGPSTASAMVGLVVISGALHQDALADWADGFGVRGDRERRLQVMRDSATGAFGVLALVGWALLLFTALEPLRGTQALRALIAAGAAGRLTALLHGVGAPPARSDGLGAGLRVAASSLAIAAVIGAAIILTSAGAVSGLVCLGICGLVASGSAVLARRSLGGSTGDTLGAAVAVTEVAVCLGLLAIWR